MSYFNYLRGYIVLWGNLVVKYMLNQERDVNSITSTKCLSSVFCKSWGKKGLWIWALGPRELIIQKVPELLEEVAPSLETCKVKVDRALSWSSWRRSLQGGWTRWPLKVPSSSNYSVILWFQGFFKSGPIKRHSRKREKSAKADESSVTQVSHKLQWSS